jgi:VanZ family protein
LVNDRGPFWGSFFYTYIRKKSALKKNVSSIVFAVIWFLLVTTLLCIPGTRLPKITWQDKIWLDKWVHIFLFMILVILWSKLYSHKKNTQSASRKIFFKIMVVGCFYGIAMEFVQKYFIPFRSFDLGDIIADGVGCLAGFFYSIKKSDPR